MTSQPGVVTQVNERVGETLINIYGYPEFPLGLSAAQLHDSMPEVAAALQSVRAALTVGAVIPLSASQGVGNPTTPAFAGPPAFTTPAAMGTPAPAIPVQGQVAHAPKCDHGFMDLGNGVGKQSGRPYKAFACPLKAGDLTSRGGCMGLVFPDKWDTYRMMGMTELRQIRAYEQANR